ncbi:hypothetical protein [Streptomyces sp. NPDC001933]|uniref:hypothetical protein n=1 Tax=Streptomyces sp. NPDC001933 TaxID=3364626 RepID=UPI00367D177E
MGLHPVHAPHGKMIWDQAAAGVPVGTHGVWKSRADTGSLVVGIGGSSAGLWMVHPVMTYDEPEFGQVPVRAGTNTLRLAHVGQHPDSTRSPGTCAIDRIGLRRTGWEPSGRSRMWEVRHDAGMSVIVEFFAAPDDASAALALRTGPQRAFESLSFGNFGPEEVLVG